MILGIQGLPRQRLKTQEGSQELSWASRGHLEPSWSHLENKSVLETPVQICLWTVIAVWLHSGAHFGARNWLKIHFFGGHFWDQFLNTFWTTFGAILGPILGPDRAKKGPRCAQEGHQRLQRPKKLHLQKP